MCSRHGVHVTNRAGKFCTRCNLEICEEHLFRAGILDNFIIVCSENMGLLRSVQFYEITNTINKLPNNA